MLKTYAGKGSDDLETLSIGGREELLGANTNTKLEGGATILVVLAKVLDVGEVVSPDGESTTTSRLGIEVMPTVLDVETQVKVTGKVDRKLDLGNYSRESSAKVNEVTST